MMSPKIKILPICAVIFTVVSVCWDDCELARALADIDVDTPQYQPSAVHFPQDQSGEEVKETTLDAKVKTQIKMDLIQYRVNENWEGALLVVWVFQVDFLLN